jgi:hypothetical protein
VKERGALVANVEEDLWTHRERPASRGVHDVLGEGLVHDVDELDDVAAVGRAVVLEDV